MRIRKIYQGQVPENAIMNGFSSSDTSTYACAYLNGTVLYNNTSGTTGTITLSDSVANYRYVELYYYYDHWAGKIYGSLKVDSPNSKRITLGCDAQYFDAKNMYWVWARITFNGSTLAFTSAGQATTIDNGSNATNQQLYIYKIIGYK